MCVCDPNDIFINVSFLIIVEFFKVIFFSWLFFTFQIFPSVNFSNFHFSIHYEFHQPFIFLAQYYIHDSLTFSRNHLCLLLNPHLWYFLGNCLLYLSLGSLSFFSLLLSALLNLPILLFYILLNVSSWFWIISLFLHALELLCVLSTTLQENLFLFLFNNEMLFN